MAVIFNQLKRNFSQIPNALFVDQRLSHGAVRVFCYIASKPDNWKVNNSDVIRQVGVSRGSLSKYWAELETFGWIKRQIRRTDGKIAGYDYELQIEPCVKNLLHKKPASEKQALEICPLSNTDSSNKEFNNTDIPETASVPEKQVSKPRKPDVVWDTIVDLFFPDGVPKSGQSRIGKIVRDLKSINATPDEIRKRHTQAKTDWKGMKFGPEALVKQWSNLGNTPTRRNFDNGVHDGL